MEILIALGMVAVGFLGAFATVLHAERMTAAAEEDALISSGIDQRIDQLRTLQWDELTDGSGITTKVWTARPETVAGIPVTQETLTISAYDIANAKTLQAVWNGTSTPTATMTGAGPALRYGQSCAGGRNSYVECPRVSKTTDTECRGRDLQRGNIKK